MSGPGKAAETEATPVLLLIVILVAAAFVWYLTRDYILEGLRWLRYGELVLISPIASLDMQFCRTWVRDIILDDPQPSMDIIRSTFACFGDINGNYDLYRLNAVSMAALAQKLAPYYRWPMVISFVGAIIWFMYFTKRTHYRTRHNLESFIKIQAKMWPVISPIVNFNPAKKSARAMGSTVPDKIPPFAEAFSPEEWLAWHRITVTNGIPDREVARRAFTQQLGPRWSGSCAGAPDYIRALFAAFALKGVQRRDESDAMLGELAQCWSIEKGLNLTPELKKKIDTAIKDPEVGGKALDIAAKHAWRTTAILGVLKWARWMGGVLAPAQFLWLRGVDRPLWYALNNLGRRSFHSEGAGAMAHFMAEENAKKALPIPRVDTAIITLNQYMSSSSAQPIPPREGDKRSTAEL